MPDELRSIVVHVSKPTLHSPAGVSTEGYYRVEGDEVVMCKPDGAEVVLDGRKYRGKFSNKSGELNERELAAKLTKDIRSDVKRNWQDKRPDGFTGAIVYPKIYY
jgi:hypothetical protein